MKSFVEAGLKDVSISRKSIKWGIPWPGDPEHVFYVWYDALTSYMSGIGYASDDPQRRARFERFWPADVHMIGKEIIRFHAVYWPAFLMAAELPLPKRIHAHGWLLFEQEKMSKSKGNVAYPEPIVKVLGNDALRYYLLRETVFGQDGNFSREALITRYNADLANGLGNLASRTLTMISDYLGGTFSDDEWKTTVQQSRSPLTRVANSAAAQVHKHYASFDFATALEVIWAVISEVDQFLTINKPWAAAKDSSKRAFVASTLYAAAETLRFVCVLAHPVLPEATQTIWAALGQSEPLGQVQMMIISCCGANLRWGRG